MSTVQLISPPLIAYQGDIFGMIPSPPIGLASIAAYVRQQGFGVSFLDCFGESPFTAGPYRHAFARIGLDEHQILERIEPEALLIGISIHSGMTASFCMELALAIKRRFNKPVAVGGPHVSICYRDFLRAGIDCAVVGEGEEPVVRLLQQLSAHAGTTGIPGVVSCQNEEDLIISAPVEMDKLPMPAWDLVPLEKYWALRMSHSPVSGRFAPIISSRGCPFNCAFCSTPRTSRRQWRGYSPERTLREIEFLKERFDIRDVFIQDDNFNYDSERVIKLCDLIAARALDVRFSLPSGVRLDTFTPEVVDALARANFRYICLAPESGSARVRRLMQKQLNEEKLYAIQRRCYQKGIRTGAFIIIGTPGEKTGDLLMTAAMIAKLIWHGADDVSIFIYSPIPGSTMAAACAEDMPQDYLGVCWTPRWRKPFKKLAWIRILLYIEYIILKLVLQPLSGFRHLRNIWRKEYETKGEMGLSRLLSNMFSRHNKMPWRAAGHEPGEPPWARKGVNNSKDV